MPGKILDMNGRPADCNHVWRPTPLNGQVQGPVGPVPFVVMICCECFTPKPVVVDLQPQSAPPINITP